MSRIELHTEIQAPPERCYDLSLSVELHLDSAAATGERIVAGVTAGVLRLGDEVTWEGRHLGLKHRLGVTISAADRPRMFRDEMTRGPFRRMTHDHYFEPSAHGTRMRDVFEFSCGVPPVDALILKPHLRLFLEQRNAFLKEVAESDRWREYLAG